VVEPLVENNGGRPPRCVLDGLLVIDAGSPEVFPCGAAIGGSGDSNGRPMHPGDAGEPRHIRPPDGVEHNPFLVCGVVDERGIARAIVNGIAIEGLGRDFVHGIGGFSPMKAACEQACYQQPAECGGEHSK